MGETEKMAGQLREMGFFRVEAAYCLRLLSIGECFNSGRLRILGAERKTTSDKTHRLKNATMSMDTM